MLLRRVYALIVIEHAARRARPAGITGKPRRLTNNTSSPQHLDGLGSPGPRLQLAVLAESGREARRHREVTSPEDDHRHGRQCLV